MRRAVLSLALLLAAIGAVTAARAEGLHAVRSLDGIDVVCVGEAGLVFRSYDGGATFVSQTVGSATLRGLAWNGLTLIAVGDGGLIWRSTDNGGTWNSQSPAGAVDLRAITTIGPVAYAVGDAGTILKSIDGGASWAPQISGVGAKLFATRFVDALEGWVAGEAGTLLHTGDGGDTWTPVPTGTPNDLLGVDVSGSTLWVVGTRATCLKSATLGASWSDVNLRLDARSDVRVVRLDSPTDVTLGGGGGFIRRSQDGGDTWSFLMHPLQSPLTDLFFLGNSGWATGGKTRAIIRTANSGATWALPTGTFPSRTWPAKKVGPNLFARGSAIALNPVFPTTMYAMMRDTVFRSRDEGETWFPASIVPDVIIPNAFIVSPKDSNVWIAAVANPQGTKRLVKTVDGGANWVTTRTDVFGDFGVPLEMDPDRPDTVYFGADNDVLYRSVDFGGTWTPHGSTLFRSPCDLVVVPESDSSLIQVGDGITGAGQWELWRSNDGGLSFNSVRTGTSSETPGMACSRLRPMTSFATHWPSGGLDRSTDGGLTWSQVNASASAWGVDIARDDPNCVVLGIYSNSRVYVALDGGTSDFQNTGFAGVTNNYGFLARDRATLFVYAGNGVYKMNISYNITAPAPQAVTVLAPDGGESWEAGSVHDVAWDATNVGLARIEYRVGPSDPWIPVADVSGTAETYAWTVPGTPTTTAEVRVRDAWDDDPEDVSNATFTITDGTVGVGELPLAFGAWQNEPNPFAGLTRIRYALPRAAEVTLEVYNVQGRRIATLVRATQEPGVYSVPFGSGAETWGGRVGALPSGVYFYRLSAGPFTTTRKMLLLR